jgi:cell division protein ZapA
MQWHDPDGVLQHGGGFLATRLGGHEALLARADGFVLRGLGRPTGWNSHATEWREKCKWDFSQKGHATGIYSGSGCDIVPIRTRGDSMSGPVKVQIFGQTYSIQGDLDGKYVQKLAKYVDDKMHAIADVTKTVDTQKVAVLAALAIADELHSMQRDRGDHEQLMREQAERCLTLVERALKQTA